MASPPGERQAIEIETGKSDIKMNVEKLRGLGFDRVVLVATSASAVGACQRALDAIGDSRAELRTWLDVGAQRQFDSICAEDGGWSCDKGGP